MDVAVLGSGDEGRDIALLSLRGGHRVDLYAAEAASAMDRVDEIRRTVADESEVERETTGLTDELEATTDLESAVSDADVVIVTEAPGDGGFQELFADVEPVVGEGTLITTGNADVPVTTAAAGLRRPDRALGFNFVELPNPSVVEVLIADQTTKEPASRADAFVETLGTTPVRVRDSPGVASTRLRLALETEAMRIVEDGVADVAGVDTLFEGMLDPSRGPLERADRAGLDARLETLDRLASDVGPRYEPPDVLERLVAAGKTGVDAGEGFYVWEGTEPAEPAVAGPELPARDGSREDPTHR